LARATGANVRDYLLPRLFTPLGLHNPQWLRCPLGYPTAESDLLLRTEELGRFALLLVREGTWTDGRQLIPAEFVRRMGTDVVDCSTGPARPSARVGSAGTAAKTSARWTETGPIAAAGSAAPPSAITRSTAVRSASWQTDDSGMPASLTARSRSSGR
jgi:CubicO group peptidase (beta-lactamase class C family)